MNWLLFYTIGHRIGLQIQNYSWASHLLAPFFLVIPYFFGKRKKVMIIPFVFFLIYTLGSVVYFRTYGQLLPLPSAHYLSNTDGLMTSVMGSFKFVDMLFTIPVTLFILNELCIKKYLVQEKLEFRIVSFLLVYSPFLLIFSFAWSTQSYKAYISEGQDNVFYYDRFYATKYNGLLSLWKWQLFQTSVIDLSKEDIQYLKMKLAGGLKKSDSINNRLSTNLIILIVESFESWTINATVNDDYITPHINEMLKYENTFFAPYIKDQTSAGRSSDAQLLINTGLLPVKDNVTSFDFDRNTFPSLAHSLSERDYSTGIYIGGSETFWNYKSFAKAQRFEHIHSHADYITSPNDCFQFGINDSTFLAQTADKITQIEEPFFAEIITLSSHTPFKLPKDMHKPIVLEHNAVYDYINAIHYTDKAIGMFLNLLEKTGLRDRTTIVVTGDHTGSRRGIELLTDSLLHLTHDSCLNTVPFIVFNSPHSGIDNRMYYQMDIYTTLIDLYSPSYFWRSFGTNIFTGDEKTDLVYQDICNISDSIIKGDYFSK